MRELNTVDVGWYGSLLLDAARCVIARQHANRDLLQRRVRVGFVMAHRLMDLLEEVGIVGPPTGDASGARVVLVPRDDMDEALEWIRALTPAKENTDA